MNRNAFNLIPGILAIVATSIVIYSCDKDDGTAPTAGFTYTSSKSLPATAQFNNMSTGSGGATFLWNFGDGATSTANHPTHTYINAGTYQVSLTQTPTSGPPETTTKTLMISTTGPSGTSHRPSNTLATDFSVVINYGVPYFVTFTNNSSGATTNHWNFGDNTTSNSGASTVTHTYNTAGPFYVVLTVTNDNGTDTSGVGIQF